MYATLYPSTNCVKVIVGAVNAETYESAANVVCRLSIPNISTDQTSPLKEVLGPNKELALEKLSSYF